jgi:hypothetical protein
MAIGYFKNKNRKNYYDASKKGPKRIENHQLLIRSDELIKFDSKYSIYSLLTNEFIGLQGSHASYTGINDCFGFSEILGSTNIKIYIKLEGSLKNVTHIHFHHSTTIL